MRSNTSERRKEDLSGKEFLRNEEVLWGKEDLRREEVLRGKEVLKKDEDLGRNLADLGDMDDDGAKRKQ